MAEDAENQLDRGDKQEHIENDLAPEILGMYLGMTTYSWHYWRENVGQGYLGYEKDEVIAWYDIRERLRRVERFDLKQNKMETE